MRTFPKQLFIAGTDTDIGKTLICASLVWGLKGHYFKPFQSGSTEGTDRAWIQDITGLGEEHFSAESYKLKAPLSPNQAAQMEQVTIDLDQVKLPKYHQPHLIIEGVGGLMVPLNPQTLLIDWLSTLDIDVLLVARSGLGTLNHTLLSIEAMRQRKIPVIGIVLNGPLNQKNATDIQSFSQIPVLAQIPPHAALNQSSLDQIYHQLVL